MYVTVESSKGTFKFFQLCLLFSCSNSNANIGGKHSLPPVGFVNAASDQNLSQIRSRLKKKKFFANMVSCLTSSFQHFKEFVEFILNSCIVAIIHVVYSSFHTVVGSSAMHIKCLLEIYI